MEMETPLPKIEKHGLPIGAIRQGKHLRMDITCMTIKLLFWHGSEDGLDNCRIDVIHDLLEKRGNVEQHRLVICRSERLRSFLISALFL